MCNFRRFYYAVFTKLSPCDRCVTIVLYNGMKSLSMNSKYNILCKFMLRTNSSTQLYVFSQEKDENGNGKIQG